MSRARDVANLIHTEEKPNRNIIINGGMGVDQRTGGGAALTALGSSNGMTYAVDRFGLYTTSTDGRLSMQKVAISDVNAPGFRSALKLSCTTADTSIAANELVSFTQQIEGQNLQTLKKGTASAEPVVASFYAKGNAAATYMFIFFDVDNNRMSTTRFTVSTSFQRFEIPIPADTTGQFDNNNGSSAYFQVYLHAGSNYTSGTYTAGTWQSDVSDQYRAPGISSILDATSRTLEITGCQLEIGNTATVFEHEPFDRTIAKCQRYYFHTYGYGHQGQTYGWSYNQSYNGMIHLIGTGNYGMATFYQFPVEMRATPTVTLKGHAGTDNRITYWNGSEASFTTVNRNTRQLTGFDFGNTSATEDYYSCGGVFDAEF